MGSSEFIFLICSITTHQLNLLQLVLPKCFIIKRIVFINFVSFLVFLSKFAVNILFDDWALSDFRITNELYMKFRKLSARDLRVRLEHLATRRQHCLESEVFTVDWLANVTIRIIKDGFQVLRSDQVFKTIRFYPRILQSLEMLHEVSYV